MVTMTLMTLMTLMTWSPWLGSEGQRALGGVRDDHDDDHVHEDYGMGVVIMVIPHPRERRKIDPIWGDPIWGDPIWDDAADWWGLDVGLFVGDI